MEALPLRRVDAPAAPAHCRDRLAERDRLEWRLTDGGDPAALAQDFLTAHGLGADDLTRPATHRPDGPCGAALYL
ncbi:aminodeoxychorismate synthase component I, partial [Micromonospora sp. Rc5]